MFRFRGSNNYKQGGQQNEEVCEHAINTESRSAIPTLTYLYSKLQSGNRDEIAMMLSPLVV